MTNDNEEPSAASAGYAPTYSGAGKTGVCQCGHAWHEHHRMMVMRQEYIDATGEAYVLGECEHYGSNELGGLMPDGDQWVNHCQGYRDSGT